MGEQASVGLTVAEDVSLLVPVLSGDQVSAQINYTGPFEAPIREGQELGELVITRDGLPAHHVPLVAENAVPKGGFNSRIRVAAEVLWSKLAPAIGLGDAPDPA